ncbi:DUF1810 domain-containing protein [Mobilicoccus pelagius]|uniref:Calpastatin n=1 Tax=Mobilicoccus pelagius NBRC 104925 TaxID=1089455 RepID=H5UVP5_9MICO|nr:DUF1810 domain-containing protein [Mobilicoccus pelagius]GAB49803.1 hypothetical protein MOPEL_135_00410 [Mobilicoccus pelagius NBRC 104925]
MSDLERFVEAQDGTYDTALAELRRGHKRSHWMWFVFPQISGLGRSPMAQRYAIADLDEARAYLAHPVLGPRLREATQAALGSGVADPVALFGGIDAMKFRSSATLFEAAADGEDRALFADVLDTFYDGERDPETLRRL